MLIESNLKSTAKLQAIFEGQRRCNVDKCFFVAAPLGNIGFCQALTRGLSSADECANYQVSWACIPFNSLMHSAWRNLKAKKRVCVTASALLSVAAWLSQGPGTLAWRVTPIDLYARRPMFPCSSWRLASSVRRTAFPLARWR
jgi:hypothetical protein